MSTPMLEASGIPTELEQGRESTIDIFAFSHDHYFKEGMKQLANVIYDEENMRLAVLVGMVARAAILFSGPPGSGKTLLASNVYRAIDETNAIGEESFAILAPDSNVQEKEIAGGEIVSTKITSRNGAKEVTEKSIDKIDAIVTPDKYGIFADELTRQGPFGVNALLSAPEERLLRTGQRVIQLPNFQVMVSTANPAEGKEATFPIGHAMGSRHAIGVLAGNALRHENKVKMLRGTMPKTAEMQSFVSLRELDLMRAAADSVVIPDKHVDRWVSQVDQAERLLQSDLRVTEKGRLIVQAGLSARIISLLCGRPEAQQSDFDMAMFLSLGSRVGAKTRDVYAAPEQLDAMASKVREAA